LLDGFRPFLPAPSLLDSLPHQLSQYCALVLAAERLIKGFFDIGWHAKVHGGHGKAPIVEDFNNRMAGISIAVKREEMEEPFSKNSLRRQAVTHHSPYPASVTSPA
jgi:hypothetical protein